VVENTNQHKALGNDIATVIIVIRTNRRILEFECQGEGVDEARKPFKAEVELWDCSGSKKYACIRMQALEPSPLSLDMKVVGRHYGMVVME